MRIGVWHALGSGGGMRVVGQQADGLSARGHEVAVAMPDWDERFMNDWYERSTRISYRSADRAWRLPYGEYLGPRVQSVVFRQHCQRVVAHMERWGADVLLIHPARRFFASPIGMLSRIPSVLYLHEPHRELYEAAPTQLWIDIPPWRRRRLPLSRAAYYAGRRHEARRERLWVQGFDRVLTNSRFSQETLIRTFGMQPRVVPLGVECPDTRPPFSGRSGVVSVGSFQPGKNPMLIIGAVAKLPEEHRTLTWVANYVDENHLAQAVGLAKATGVKLQLRRSVSDAEREEIVRSSRLFVYAPQLEPFGLAPLEAMTAGTPVVAVAQGGVRETVVDGVGVLATEMSTDAIAAASLRIVQNPEFAADLAARAFDYVKHKWSLEASTVALEAELEAVRANATP